MFERHSLDKDHFIFRKTDASSEFRVRMKVEDLAVHFTVLYLGPFYTVPTTRWQAQTLDLYSNNLNFFKHYKVQ